MGIKISNTFTPELTYINFRPSDWFIVRKNQPRQSVFFGKYTVFQNKFTSQCIDMYSMIFQSEEAQNQYKKMSLERTKQQQIVKCIHFEPITIKELCSQSHQANIYIQHIPVRLSDISDIPYVQSLYILKNALKGYQKLYRKNGYFQVIQQQVCIDEEGKLRVWLNSNLSKKQPLGFSDHSITTYLQRSLCKQIITLISKNTQNNVQNHPQSIPFIDYIQTHSLTPPSFNQALILLQNYLRVAKIQIPDYCESIVQIFQEEYGDEIFPLAPICNQIQSSDRYTLNSYRNTQPLQITSNRSRYQPKSTGRSQKLSLKSRQFLQRNFSNSNIRKTHPSYSNSANQLFDKNQNNKTKSQSNSINSDLESRYCEYYNGNYNAQKGVYYKNNYEIQSRQFPYCQNTSEIFSNQATPSKTPFQQINFNYINNLPRNNAKLVSFAGFDQIQNQNNSSVEFQYFKTKQNRESQDSIHSSENVSLNYKRQAKLDTIKLRQVLSVVEEEDIDPQIMADIIKMNA